MPRTWLARVNAVFLTALLGAGGSGLPVFDAFFHHLRSGKPLCAAVHNADTAAGHAERCTLGAPLPALLRAPRLATGIPEAVARRAPAARPAGAAPRSSDAQTPALPRAPPVLIN